MNDPLEELERGAKRIQNGMEQFGSHLLSSTMQLGKQIMAKSGSAQEDGAGFMDKVRDFFDDLAGQDKEQADKEE